MFTSYLKFFDPRQIMMQGDVLGGRSFVDESMLTGESLPVFKERGLSVFAGTVNWVCSSFKFIVSSEIFFYIIIRAFKATSPQAT